ncbi:MAG: hypothetical protein WAX77_09055 [Methylococcaceae bacterium]
MTKNLFLLALLLVSQNSFADLIAANQYHCTAKNITVDYSSSSFIGQPQINIMIGKKGYGAMGSDLIQNQATVLGNLITITKNAKPDLYTDSLTVLLPDVNVNALGESVSFKSQLLVTRTATSIGGPALVNGVIQSNSAKTLECTATAVLF